MDTFWTHFSTTFRHFHEFSCFYPFSVFSELSDPRVVISSWTSSMFLSRKVGKFTNFRGPKCGVQRGAKSGKKWSLPKGLSKPRGSVQNSKTRGQKKSQKIALFEEAVKKCTFCTFSHFFESGKKCQKDPRFSGDFAKTVQNETNKRSF